MQSISTEAGVGGTVLYLERGERHTITMGWEVVVIINATG